MYHNKEKVATKLYELLDDFILEGDDVPVSIDKLLSPKQKYDLIMGIVRGLPPTLLERVLYLKTKFKRPVEDTFVLDNFKYKQRVFKTILDRTIELGFCLGLSKNEIYEEIISSLGKINDKDISSNLTNVYSNILELLYTTYDALDIFNLTSIYDEGIEEIYDSHISKLIPDNEIGVSTLKQSIQQLNAQGYITESMKLNNGYILIIDRITGKVLKPVSYVKPNLELIIYNYLKEHGNK